MTQWLINLVTHWGLLAIFVTMAGESAGLHISSEIVVPLGGALAADHHLNFWAVVVMSTLGNLGGSLVAFWLARKYGEAAVLRFGRRVGINRHHLQMTQRFFDRHGAAAVFIGRLLPVVRTYISFPAGVSSIRLTPFVLLTVAGALPWNLGLAYAGLQLGRHYTAVEHYLSWLTIVIGVLVVIGLVLLWRAGRAAVKAAE